MDQQPLQPILAYPYVLPQHFTKRYSDNDAIIRGTLFPELDLPFRDFEIRTHLPKTPMTELMMLEFVFFELQLYLDVNPGDENAAALLEEYKKKSAAAKEEVFGNSDWVYDPWPWEGEV